MLLLRRLLRSIQTKVRYKLLAMVLLPILLVMPVSLALAVYWGAKLTYDQLFIKVNTDLSVAQDAFSRIQEDYLRLLEQLAESHDFHLALEVHNDDAIQQQVEKLQKSAGFSYLRVLRPASDARDAALREPLSPLYLRALQGQAVSGIEVFSEADLKALDEGLAEQVRLPLRKTPRARPTREQLSNRGMMVRVIYPLTNSWDSTESVLDGGVLLNGNFAFVDEIRDLVYGPGSLPAESIGTVTVFLDDVRISTNVPLEPGQRALGTRVSKEVRNRVLEQGEVWINRAFVVNDWYISAYQPIYDVNGERVGMLYSGFLEAPYRREIWQTVAVLAAAVLLLTAVYSLIAVKGAETIFKPIEAISSVVQATRREQSQRIGRVSSQDELGELAREFDAMLDLLDQRKQEIEGWVDRLEAKVKERTAELERRNSDLQRTVRLLRQTRRQLVLAEKLAALGELTAGIAHEINNPAAVILGNLDVLVSELGAQATPVRHEIDLMIEQIYRIKDIVDNLLQYARPESFAGYLTEVDINTLVTETLKLVRHVRAKGEFSIDLNLRAKRSVTINRQELQQVLVNLLVNAIHALGAKPGKIGVYSWDWDSRGVVIEVADDGEGMDEARMERIFDPFFSTRGQGEGTGLGLSVSYGLIRRYGGNITVKSTPGQGSRFRIWLLTTPVMDVDEEAMISRFELEELH